MVKNASLRGVPASPSLSELHLDNGNAAHLPRLRRTVESALYVLVGDSIDGETRELGLLLRSAKERGDKNERRTIVSRFLSLGSIRASLVKLLDKCRRRHFHTIELSFLFPLRLHSREVAHCFR